jgi:type III restriction enzyme
MKLKFKVQGYQTEAVNSLVDVFSGQNTSAGSSFQVNTQTNQIPGLLEVGIRNADLQISRERLLDNIRSIQERSNLQKSESLIGSIAGDVNLDIEMETGTGKTYVYIKSIFELHRQYGWTKFIIVVPSIAIREGVLKSFDVTAEHFLEKYGSKAKYFTYNSKQLQQIESFASGAGINVMIINTQAFNAAGKDNRRIYEVLDDFQTRRPIDVISDTNPFLILDEPQKMEGKKTLEALAQFKPLAIARYSATHKTTHNKVHRLDALDAYNRKLVKKIAVRGVAVKGLAGTNPYVYADSIELSHQEPTARLEVEVKQANGIKRIVRKINKGSNLEEISNGLAQYKGFVVANIDAINDSVEFINGTKVFLGEAIGDVTEETIRRIQIRETIKAHFEKEKQLFSQGIKVLSLFFIDEVAKYRDYSSEDEKGIYATIFEDEYSQALELELTRATIEEPDYAAFLVSIATTATHKGYFSIDKKSQRMVDPEVKSRGEEAGLADDVSAYDLILKDKERLLSFEEPTRFIFSHSALREGWDNPNVFVMCMLKHSDNTISRRQEVGRGLRLSVNQAGDRMDNPNTVHQINELTVVAGESYADFVNHLQREIKDALSDRPKKANVDYFLGQVITTESGALSIDETTARNIYKYLVKNDYIDDLDQISISFTQAKDDGELAPFPESLNDIETEVLRLIGGLYANAALPHIEDGRKGKVLELNSNFDKKEFQELWARINHKAIYRVDFDSEELTANAIDAINRELHVSPLQYTVQTGAQKSKISDEQMQHGDTFSSSSIRIETHSQALSTGVKYDLLGNLSSGTQLKRTTIVKILTGIKPEVFAKYRINPENFMAEAGRLINEQKASMVVEHINYDPINEKFDSAIFTASQLKVDLTKAGQKLKNHIYDYALTDSEGERNFASQLDQSLDVEVFAKLPKGFSIPTPVGDYNPDWAIAFKDGAVKHIYFVAETKGSMSSMQLRHVEQSKIECAKKFFEEINTMYAPREIKYGVVSTFGKLMEIVSS